MATRKDDADQKDQKDQTAHKSGAQVQSGQDPDVLQKMQAVAKTNGSQVSQVDGGRIRLQDPQGGYTLFEQTENGKLRVVESKDSSGAVKSTPAKGQEIAIDDLGGIAQASASGSTTSGVAPMDSAGNSQAQASGSTSAAELNKSK